MENIKKICDKTDYINETRTERDYYYYTNGYQDCLNNEFQQYKQQINELITKYENKVFSEQERKARYIQGYYRAIYTNEKLETTSFDNNIKRFEEIIDDLSKLKEHDKESGE